MISRYEARSQQSGDLPDDQADPARDADVISVMPQTKYALCGVGSGIGFKDWGAHELKVFHPERS